MTSQLTNYQCPSCGGPLHFEEDSGKLACEYCNSVFSVEEIDGAFGEKNEEAEAAFHEDVEQDGAWETNFQQWDEAEGKMRAYQCPACGAELICDETTAASSCPYCGNPVVVPGQFSGVLKPDFIIPFKLDKKAAMEALRRHYKGKLLLPKLFTAQQQIEKVQGIYVPFWLFDGKAEGSASYHCTRTHMHTQGDYRVYITDHYRVNRSGNMAFEKIPADGSTKMPDAHMDSIEPFDYSELKPFSLSYLPGFLAHKYDVPSEDCTARTDQRCKTSLEEGLRESVIGYETCVPRTGDVHLHHGKVYYALLPVWMLTTVWNGKKYLFAMNGQTGKLVGDLPVSWGRFFGWFAGISLPLMVILGLWLL